MKFRSSALAVTIAVAVGFAAAPVAGAMPAAKLLAEAVPDITKSDVVKVGHRGKVSVGIYWHAGHIYLNGHRGYHRYRHGYRKHHGHWFPPRAFVVVHPHPRYVYVPRYRKPHIVKPRVIRLSQAHMRWCDDRYRSYRHSDNTFQPYHGPRKPCVSPYY